MLTRARFATSAGRVAAVTTARDPDATAGAGQPAVRAAPSGSSTRSGTSLRSTRVLLNMYDPLFMRTIKASAEKYRNAFYGERPMPLSKQAFLDIDEHGPAWHLGHMRTAARVLGEKMDSFDFIVDIRDARLPFTTCNPELLELTREKKRIIVFNKAELANEEANVALQKYFEDQGMYAIFTSLRYTWKDTVDTIRKFVKYVLPAKNHKLTAHVGCVVGMPNVGKSTLINALRMAHEYQFHREDMRRVRVGEAVSITPGTTRSVRSVPISRDPNIVLFDSPGITMPGCMHTEAGFKLAACGIVPVTENGMLTPSRVARFIYDILVAAGAAEHMAECLHLTRAPVSFQDLVTMIAERSGSSASTPLGNIHLDKAETIVLTDFLTGRLGRITLDRIPDRVVRANANNEQLQIGASDFTDGGAATAGDKPASASKFGSYDMNEFTYTHHVKATEAERTYPAHMATVLRAIHEEPITGGADGSGSAASSSGGAQSIDAERREKAARGAAKVGAFSERTQLDAGVISRRKGPVAREAWSFDLDSVRIRRPEFEPRGPRPAHAGALRQGRNRPLQHRG